MVTQAQAGPNFGRSIRIKQGGPLVLISSMSDGHVLNYQHYINALIWHCDTYNEAYSGNIKSKAEAVEIFRWLTNEINWRGLKQYPRKHDYIRLKQAENRQKTLLRVQKKPNVLVKNTISFTKKQAKKVIDSLPDGTQVQLTF